MSTIQLTDVSVDILFMTLRVHRCVRLFSAARSAGDLRKPALMSSFMH